MIPKKVFFTKGVGRHKDYLQSFELALRDAGIEKCNLVNVSSIFPPYCKMISREQGVKELKPGEITFCVLARNSTNEPNRLVVSSIGCAVPSGDENYGYLSEHHSFGETEKVAGEYAESLAVAMLATTLGLDFDPTKDCKISAAECKMSDKIVRTRSVTQSALGDKGGLWTTVLSAAVFIVDGQEAIEPQLEPAQEEKTEIKSQNNDQAKPQNNCQKKSQSSQTKSPINDPDNSKKNDNNHKKSNGK